LLRYILVILCLCFLSGRCQDKNEVAPIKPVPTIPPNNGVTSTKQILFVGNSLTYSNDLPKLVAQYGASKGNQITTQTLAYGGYALEDHWNDGELQQLITKGSFDFVVVQQGPSSQADGREMLFDYGERIAALCEVRGAKLVFFMVWPAKVNYHTFDGVIKNYTDAAAHSGSLLCPVGKVWKDHFDSTNDFSYYGPDQFHPSLEGSTVAAQIIYETLFK
jgi:hypothetical protein